LLSFGRIVLGVVTMGAFFMVEVIGFFLLLFKEALWVCFLGGAEWDVEGSFLV